MNDFSVRARSVGLYLRRTSHPADSLRLWC